MRPKARPIKCTHALCYGKNKFDTTSAFAHDVNHIISNLRSLFLNMKGHFIFHITKADCELSKPKLLNLICVHVCLVLGSK